MHCRLGPWTLNRFSRACQQSTLSYIRALHGVRYCYISYPQAWKGLIDCLERAGAGRVDALPECLVRAAEIAEGKGNFLRARTLRVRLGTVLDALGKQEEALEAVRSGLRLSMY